VPLRGVPVCGCIVNLGSCWWRVVKEKKDKRDGKLLPFSLGEKKNKSLLLVYKYKKLMFYYNFKERNYFNIFLIKSLF
jgi:hypothetical protein